MISLETVVPELFVQGLRTVGDVTLKAVIYQVFLGKSCESTGSCSIAEEGLQTISDYQALWFLHLHLVPLDF